MANRIEKDNLGQIEIPSEAYYGIQTERDSNNVKIVKRSINRQMIKALSIVKKCAARANAELEKLDINKAKYIELACDEIFNGRLHGQFITDLIQGSSGAGWNVNANEIIVNRANELAGYKKGKYDFITRADVELNQLSQTVVPICGKFATIKLLKKLLTELKKMIKTIDDITENVYNNFNTMYQEFSAMKSILDRSYQQIQESIKNISVIHFNKQAVNTENKRIFCKTWIKYISIESIEKFSLSETADDNFQDMDALNNVATVVENLALNTSKIANDLTFLSSSFGYKGVKVILPTIDNYSENIYQDQILEVVRQVEIYTYGCKASIAKAVEMSYVNSHAYEPVILFVLFDMITYLRRSIRTLREKTLEGLVIELIK